jgi:hypothetical protein
MRGLSSEHIAGVSDDDAAADQTEKLVASVNELLLLCKRTTVSDSNDSSNSAHHAHMSARAVNSLHVDACTVKRPREIDPIAIRPNGAPRPTVGPIDDDRAAVRMSPS